ncbi:IS630 family transposase [Streptomyces sp. NPDC054775]
MAQRRLVVNAGTLNQLMRWCEQWPERRFAVEGARGLGRTLAQQLAAGGENVVDVPATLSARARLLATGGDRKTDANDARHVTQVALFRHDLRVVEPEDQTTILRLLTERHDDLVHERTRVLNRLHAVLRDLRIVTGHAMTEQGVGKWLRRHGFSPQRPDRPSYRQDQARVDVWLREEYPAITARATAEHAVVAWADQCGLRSDTAPPGRSWAPAGQTPTVKVSGRRFRVNVMSAIASRGSLWFTVFTGKFTAKVFTAFLDRLARQAGRKVHVIADRHPVHRSKTVRTWLDANAERIELHLMPGYSPELNPDEILNADIKRNVHAARARSVDDLARETRRFLHRR